MVNKFLWPITPIIIIVASITLGIGTAISGGTFWEELFSFVICIFFGVLGWILIAMFLMQSSALEKITQAILIWIREHENPALAFLGSILILFLSLSIAWGIIIYTASPEESIAFLKASFRFEIAAIVLLIFGILFYLLAKMGKVTRLDNELEKKIMPEFVDQNPQASIKHAFTIFEDRIRNRLDASAGMYGETLIPYFCATAAQFYSITQGQAVSNRN
jgi:hypothetical protein